MRSDYCDENHENRSHRGCYYFETAVHGIVSMARTPFLLPSSVASSASPSHKSDQLLNSEAQAVYPFRICLLPSTVAGALNSEVLADLQLVS